jgi:membrane protease YdiL (CAAX protease family)
MTAIASEKAIAAENQYSLSKILGLWAAVTVPTGLMAWVVFPALAPDFDADPLGFAATRMAALTVGLVWQFVLTMIIVRREEGDLRWVSIRRRLWLNAPRDPKTGKSGRQLWRWLVLLVFLHFVAAALILPLVEQVFVDIVPALAAPEGYELGSMLEDAAIKEQMVGAWGILGLFLLMGVFNTVLGEEFFFRGALLPKMEGAFGKWDWLANGVLGTLYHVSMPWSWIGTTGGTWIFFYALPARYFRSTWVSIINHSSIIVFWSFLFLGLILGLA